MSGGMHRLSGRGKKHPASGGLPGMRTECKTERNIIAGMLRQAGKQVSMGRKKLFSLIEIAVAMAVAAIGVAAIMALLPIAVKSSSDSIGDTLAADAANTVFSKLDTYAWVGSDDADGKDVFATILALPTTKPSAKTNIRSLVSDDKKMGEDSYEFISAGGEGHWLLLFGQTGESPDFEAEVICWRETLNTSLRLTYMEPGRNKPNTLPLTLAGLKPESGKLPFTRVYVEITWPVRKPYKVGSNSYPRQSRFFVREYLDPTFTVTPKGD